MGYVERLHVTESERCSGLSHYQDEQLKCSTAGRVEAALARDFGYVSHALWVDERDFGIIILQ